MNYEEKYHREVISHLATKQLLEITERELEEKKKRIALFLEQMKKFK